MPLGLEVKNIRKAFAKRTALHDTSLTVPQGQFVCILGPSGCGKTTLLRIIAGLEQPTSGAIFLDGADITARPVHQRNFAMVFQSLALFPFLTVAENIGYALSLRNYDSREEKARVNELLALIRLPDIGGRKISELSGGQRQRVAIARALAQEPMLFLMDEPFSALDAELRDHMQVELRQLQRALKITTILVTHDQREAMTLADIMVVMADGVVQQIGAPAELYRNPANIFVSSFIGRSNLLPVKVANAGNVVWGESTLSVKAVPAALKSGDNATLAVRREGIYLAKDGIEASVKFVRDVGGRIELRLICQNQELLASLDPAQWNAHARSESVHINISPDAATVLST
ncbi:putative spermidine/putrescine transport system ATP-binding protein [Rhizomicrobium palustre]|uniref:Putative spermidine/putrescine transport system ATP-binding protein n=1 Tax=Rhizomicrobium palustre TaxID=189966 RepID=A0A846N1N2_9PROT|nr:ABC transporter ATP-binding protein [Rhizomicrobium palustre]NIK89513.1 putative spermidine/putrescine transport system ATP-binding protein [Rhizomicrobium palustre]